MNDFTRTNRSQRHLRILRVFRVACLSFLTVSILIALAFCFVFSRGGRPGGGGDFNIRYSEIRCLFDGMDPFKVYTGEIVSDKYGPYNKWTREKPFLPVNGYVPWEYTYMMPFAALPKIPASVLWVALEVAALWFLLQKATYLSRIHARTPLQKAFIESCTLVLVFPFGSVLNWGNFGLLFAVAILWMADTLNRKQDILAGVLWAFLMAKPQIGLLFAIPIALRFRWKTALTAILVCVIASIPPAVLCHVSPVRMTIDILTCAQRGQFHMDLLPPSWASFFASGTPQHIFMLAGALLCLTCCITFRRSTDWTIFLLPPALVSTVWTYGWPHDHCIYAILVLVLAVTLCHERQRGVRCLLLVELLLCGASVLLIGVTAQPAIPGLAYQALHGVFPSAPTWIFGWLSGRNNSPYWVYRACAVGKVILFPVVCIYLSKISDFRLFPGKEPAPVSLGTLTEVEE